jgi:hypothetical protein
MNSEVRSIQTSTFDSDYWLCRCEGFRVDSGDCRLGFVEGMRFLSRLDRPDELAVRAGPLGRRRLFIPVAEVMEIRPGEGLIVVSSAPRAAKDELVPRLESRLRAALGAAASALGHRLALARAWLTAANR